MKHLYLIAQIAGRSVAIASDQIESVVDIQEIVPVPGADARIAGLAALRSRVMTVVDSSCALGLPPIADASRAVITQIADHHYAVLVDRIDDVAPFDLLPLATGIALDARWRQAGIGVVERDGDPVLAIDLATLVPGFAEAAA